MKFIALAAIVLLLTGCASSGIVDERTLQCGPGQDIEVMAGLSKMIGTHDDDSEERFDLLVEVANNSHEDVTVTVLRIDQLSTTETRYRLDGGVIQANQLIEEGKDYTFRLPTRGRWTRPADDPRVKLSSPSADELELSVLVSLANGDSYRCRFDLAGR